jgi:two-component system CheB/CheR fusion protein
VVKKKTNKGAMTQKGKPAKKSVAATESLQASPTLPTEATEVGIESERPGPLVAGIGASAGGLDAFKKLFTAMPHDSGIAFVLVPHLDPKHESLMVELLTRHTSMPVVEAGEGMPVEANHVYIIPT